VDQVDIMQLLHRLAKFKKGERCPVMANHPKGPTVMPQLVLLTEHLSDKVQTGLIFKRADQLDTRHIFNFVGVL
jgi:hypothetical protein